MILNKNSLIPYYSYATVLLPMFLFLSNNQVMRTVFYQAVVVVVADVVEVVGAGVDGVAKLIVTEGKTSVHASANSNCSVARKATTKIKTNEVERNIF